MIRRSIFAILGSAISWAQAVQAQDLLHLRPASPWALEYADDSCRLVRTFGTGENEVTLGLTAYELGGRFFVSAVGNPTRTFRSPAYVRLSIGDIEDFNVRYLQVDFEGRPGILITNAISVGPLPDEARKQLESRRPVESFSDPAIEDQVETIGFIDGFEQEFMLHTGSLREPMRALKDCNAELLTHWDIDVAAHGGLTRIAFPKSPPYRWLRLRAYPREMRQPMLVNYRLTVDVEGGVAGCHVSGAPQDSEFAKATCGQLRKNGRFDPALDADGAPVQSYFVSWAELRG